MVYMRDAPVMLNHSNRLPPKLTHFHKDTPATYISSGPGQFLSCPF